MPDVLILREPASLDVDEIRRRATPLLAQHGAVEAWLIGSYARGSADAWSDVDLVAVMPTPSTFVDRPLELTDVMDAFPVAVDLLVYTPEEFERGMRNGSGIYDAIQTEGSGSFERAQ